MITELTQYEYSLIELPSFAWLLFNANKYVVLKATKSPVLPRGAKKSNSRRVDNNPTELYCAGCNEYKPTTEFSTQSRKLVTGICVDYYQSRCRGCSANYQKQKLKGVY